MVEEALVEALAQEHFNYIAEGDDPVGQAAASAPPNGCGGGHASSGRSSWRNKLLFFWSPQAVMSALTLVASAVLAKHLKEFLVEFTRDALSYDGEGGGEGRESTANRSVVSAER